MRNNKNQKWLQDAVWRKSQGRCVYCGDYVRKMAARPGPEVLKSGKFRTVDHIIPKKHQGGKTLRNLVPACGTCNTRRGHAWPPSKMAHPDFRALVQGMENQIRQGISGRPKASRTWVGKQDEFQAMQAREKP